MFRSQVSFALLVVALLTISACSNEELDIYTLYDSAWCVVQGKGNQMALVTDDKGILKPSETLDSLRFKAGDRYRVIYIPLATQGGHYYATGSSLVEITSFQPVLVEDVLQRSAFSGVVNDPVWVNTAPFFGGGFLNFDFQFYSTEGSVKHGIHLLQDSLVNRTLYLRFGHDANADGRTKVSSALASFSIGSLKHDSKADSLIIRIKSETMDKMYRLALRDTL